MIYSSYEHFTVKASSFVQLVFPTGQITSIDPSPPIIPTTSSVSSSLNTRLVYTELISPISPTFFRPYKTNMEQVYSLVLKLKLHGPN